MTAPHVETVFGAAIVALAANDRDASGWCREALREATYLGVDVHRASDDLRECGAAFLAELQPTLGPAHQTIGGPADPYMRRWYLQRRKEAQNVYLHQFLRSDDPRAPHDHPWLSVSLMLFGQAREIVGRHGEQTRLVSAGDIVVRRPDLAHRLELIDGQPAWTLLITGPATRSWGFWCDRGRRFVHWKKFTDPTGNAVGPGCNA